MFPVGVPFGQGRARRIPAFTLLEVVVGLFLLGMLATTVSVALSRVERNAVRMDHQRQAIQWLDVLLMKWTESRAGIPVPTAGSIIGQRRMDYRTRFIKESFLCGNPVHVIRIEVLDPNLSEPTILASVEVVQSVGAQQRNAFGFR